MGKTMRDIAQTVAFSWRRLPHWQVAEGRYFITVHLAGALPAAAQDRIRAMRTALDDDAAHGQNGLRQRRAMFREMETWLDRAAPVEHLRQPQVAEMLTEAITHRERTGVWTVSSYVIMPNHMHLFLSLGRSLAADGSTGITRPRPPMALGTSDMPAGMRCPVSLERALLPFKRRTAQAAKQILGLGRCRFWQREWFDHWSRSRDEDSRIEEYIRRNPVKAGLVSSPADWPYLR
jgi:REP element-mobilizing transposase RayT